MSTRILILKDGVITPTKSSNDTNAVINSLGVLDLNSNQTIGGIKTFSGGLTLSSNLGTSIGAIWRNVDNLEYKDSTNVTRITLNSAGNLSNLSNKQTALNNLSGAVTTGTYLRGNGTNVLLSAIQVGDIPTLNQNTTGSASNITGVLNLLNGGTGATTQQTAINTLVGTQTANRVLKSNGTNMLLAQVGLTTDVIGTLPIANGGTNSTTQNFVDLTTPQTVGGLKTFTSVPLIQGPNPGFWLDETDHTAKGAFLVLDEGIFQIQRRSTNFGGFEASLFNVNLISGTVNCTGGFDSTSTTTGALVVTGGVGIGGNQNIGGFTSLGDNIAIKKKYITGTSAAAQGDSAMIPHGINTAKFRGITVLIEYTLNSFMPQMFIAQAGYCFGFYVQGSDVIVQNVNVSGFSSLGILSKPVHIVIEYIA